MNRLFLAISVLAAGAVLAVWLMFPSAANQAGDVISHRASLPFVEFPVVRQKQMRAIPDSNQFRDLTWDEEIPQWPTLNGVCRHKNGKDVEVALVGDSNPDVNWEHFTRQSEETWKLLQDFESRILGRAAPEIFRKHRDYFGSRWGNLTESSLSELSLRLVCFYLDGSVHLWYSGSAVFNHLDVDIGLDAELRITEVRFDG